MPMPYKMQFIETSLKSVNSLNVNKPGTIHHCGIQFLAADASTATPHFAFALFLCGNQNKKLKV